MTSEGAREGKPSILIVDDQAANLKVISSVLSESYRLYVANSGERALRILDVAQPDLILLDIMMPEMDGFEVCRRLKESDGATKDIPVIFLTAKTEIEDIMRGFEIGGVDYITKPFNIKEVNARISTHLLLSSSLNRIKEQNLELELANSRLRDTQDELVKRNDDLVLAHGAIEEHAFQINQINQQLLESEYRLKVRNEELTDVNSEKDRFFSIIAHDLRSPFSGLLGLLQMLNENDIEISDAERKELLGMLYDSTKNVYSLLENLLEWSRLQRGVINFNPETISISLIVSHVLNVIQTNASLKEISISSKIDSEVYGYADPQMLNTVLRNLLSNAVKFTKRGGKINISANANDTEIIICIEDSGIGIQKDNLENLFKLSNHNYRLGTEGERSTGLGLLLCKELIGKNNGRIWAESKFGVGSQFYVALPVGNFNEIESTPLL